MKDYINERFIENANRMLKDRHMTRREFADKVGVSEVTISRTLEMARPVHLSMAVKMAEALGMTLDALLDGKKTMSNGDYIRAMDDDRLAEWLGHQMELKDAVEFHALRNFIKNEYKGEDIP